MTAWLRGHPTLLPLKTTVSGDEPGISLQTLGGRGYAGSSALLRGLTPPIGDPFRSALWDTSVFNVVVLLLFFLPN